MAPATATRRQTAAERRESILQAAFAEFAVGGFHGTSTESIARRAGISQPYLFRLFGTKKELFVATVERGFERTLETFRSAAEGLRGREAFAAMGAAYLELLRDRSLLLVQMQAYAATEDPDVADVVRRRFGNLVEYVERVTGAAPEDVRDFFARGMLLNVAASMDLLGSRAGWADRLLGACRQP
jgi:AcrR family transcriptional regulator